MNVGEGEYPITIGPYGYFWFQADVAEKKEKEASGELPLIKTDVSWEKLFDNYNEVRDSGKESPSSVHEKMPVVRR